MVKIRAQFVYFHAFTTGQEINDPDHYCEKFYIEKVRWNFVGI